MILLPAIDIMNNRAVRLLHGDKNKVTDYGRPEEAAIRWQSEGAKWLHLVDLDAAFGSPEINALSIKRIIESVKIPVQIGGGIRNMDVIKYYLEDLGAARVILGTAAVLNPSLINEATAKYGGRIACGIDAADGKVAIKGWAESSKLAPLELALDVKKKGVNTIIFTDISKDGALSGASITETVNLQNECGMNVVASGGVNSLDDLKRLSAAGLYGAIIGRALYSGGVKLKEALEVLD